MGDSSAYVKERRYGMAKRGVRRKRKKAHMDCRKMRARVDIIDQEIIDLIAQRMAMIRVIFQHKKQALMPILDRDREQQLRQIWQVRAKHLGLDDKKILDILEKLLCMSREFQKGRIH
jgi:chorismate mutase